MSQIRATPGWQAYVFFSTHTGSFKSVSFSFPFIFHNFLIERLTACVSPAVHSFQSNRSEWPRAELERTASACRSAHSRERASVQRCGPGVTDGLGTVGGLLFPLLCRLYHDVHAREGLEDPFFPPGNMIWFACLYSHKRIYALHRICVSTALASCTQLVINR